MAVVLQVILHFAVCRFAHLYLFTLSWGIACQSTNVWSLFSDIVKLCALNKCLRPMLSHLWIHKTWNWGQQRAKEGRRELGHPRVPRLGLTEHRRLCEAHSQAWLHGILIHGREMGGHRDVCKRAQSKQPQFTGLHSDVNSQTKGEQAWPRGGVEAAGWRSCAFLEK